MFVEYPDVPSPMPNLYYYIVIVDMLSSQE